MRHSCATIAGRNKHNRWAREKKAIGTHDAFSVLKISLVVRNGVPNDRAPVARVTTAWQQLVDSIDASSAEEVTTVSDIQASYRSRKHVVHDRCYIRGANRWVKLTQSLDLAGREKKNDRCARMLFPFWNFSSSCEMKCWTILFLLHAVTALGNSLLIASAVALQTR